jgi:hypothetical protein
MAKLIEPLPIYLDQNVLSLLRKGKQERDELTRILKAVAEKTNSILVCSKVHVDECRDSSHPESFAEVIDEFPIYYLESFEASDQQVPAVLGRAPSLILEPEDISHKAQRLMEGLLKVIQYCSGWLDAHDSEALKTELIQQAGEFWDNLTDELDEELISDEFNSELRDQAIAAITLIKREISSQITNLPVEHTKDTWKSALATLRVRLPQNLAQLDDVPSEEVVSYLFSLLDTHEKQFAEKQFPKKFWNSLEPRKTGELIELAFMLFMFGLVRDKRVRTGHKNKRVQHFLGQFRDALHIENAARCAAFITCDKGAARLAKSLYSYAGVRTEVIQLKISVENS